jgi:hypothetical protein
MTLDPTPSTQPNSGTAGRPDVSAADALDVSRPHPARVYQAWLGGKETFGPDRDAAERVAALAPGSSVVVSHVADLPDDERPERAAATREAAALYEELAGPFTLRTPDEIAELFTGLDLLDPGVVPANQWCPPRSRPGRPVPVLAGVGRVWDPKPATPPAQD